MREHLPHKSRKGVERESPPRALTRNGRTKKEKKKKTSLDGVRAITIILIEIGADGTIRTHTHFLLLHTNEQDEKQPQRKSAADEEAVPSKLCGRRKGRRYQRVRTTGEDIGVHRAAPHGKTFSQQMCRLCTRRRASEMCGAPKKPSLLTLNRPE